MSKNKRELTWRKARGKEFFLSRLKGELAGNEFGYIPNDTFFKSCFMAELKNGGYIKNHDKHLFHFDVLKDFIYEDHRSSGARAHFMEGDEIIIDEEYTFWL